MSTEQKTNTDPFAYINKMTLEQLAKEMPGVRDRIKTARNELKKCFEGKDDVVDMLFYGAASNSPVLVLGPPGTAKSALIVQMAESIGVDQDRYFEYMLNKFTEPSEIIGPVNIQRLKEGAYIRQIEGKLPTCYIAFLDEIFKSNSAILNTLLTIINENKFYQNGKAEPVAMKMLFAATNEIPDHTDLDALKDRFVFKVPSPYVQDDCFDELIEAGLDGDLNRSVGHKPWKGHCSIDDFLKLRRYMTLLMRVTQEKGEGDRKTYFPDNVYMLFRKIVRTLSKDAGAGLSDRKVIKLYRIIRTIAYLEDGGVVQPKHLRSLRYTANSAKDVQNVKDTVDNILRLES